MRMMRPVKSQNGFLLIEVMLSLFLLSLLGTAIVAYLSYHLRIHATIHAQLSPKCSNPTCSHGDTYDLCTCGTRKHLVLH